MSALLTKLKLVSSVRKREAWHYSHFSNCISRPGWCLQKKKNIWNFIEKEKFPTNISGPGMINLAACIVQKNLRRPLSSFANNSIFIHFVQLQPGI